ncbi:MerR family transcriptional regulator [Streptomyces pathocidini]|uniref:MerR family transcriptional regulator n=2 Tax=Streptomyces pathocidini TaxID=1650571 RepID=A0ABW7UVB6_9ACTN|nr:MerR family transcriptional regulator [Streptomyces pathocidini]
MTAVDRQGLAEPEYLTDHEPGDPRWRLLTTAEAAEAVGVSPACIRQWKRRGYLRPIARYRTNGSLLYREDHVLEVERDRRAARRPRRSSDGHARAGAEAATGHP